ncbi:MAG: carbohydrate-binding protein [Leeuwenhoekiella sp.]|nr:carbohydrate-binding protein [Leeuwenhoekiella sp.]MBA82852.1 carbohydrate-binding protein [Leeuwenhoekiella sp.]
MLFVAFIAFTSCSDDSNSSERGTAGMSLRLVDGPGDYDHVFIDVEAVVVKYNEDFDDNDDATDDDDFERDEYELLVDPEIYDLLELTGGSYALLADENIPAGAINQIRLILGSDNTVVVDGQAYPLQTPSAQQSGLKVQFNQNLEAGVFYTVVLDFDVKKSIVTQGNGSYLLKPVIRASAIEATGAISGSVFTTGDVVIPATVSTLVGGTEVSTSTNADGDFELVGLPEGNYDLTVRAEITEGVITTFIVEDVTVENGETTSAGVITVVEE